MAYDRGSILQQFPNEITNILQATTADPKDEAARMKVATTLARVLSFTKRRTGEDRVPADTEVYKLAKAVREAHSRDQFEEILGQAIPHAKSGILEKYDLDWKLAWSGAKEPAEKKRRGRRPGKAEPAQAPVPDLASKVDALEKIVARMEKQLSDLAVKMESARTRKLAGQLDEVLQKLKAHQHDREDGKAYILEKKEL